MRRAIAAAVAGGIAAPLALAGCGGGDGDGADASVDAPTRRFGGDRPVTLQVPPDLAPGESLPLLLILHGYSASGFVQQAYLGLADVAAEARVFVLAPDGTADTTGRLAWNASDACCGSGPRPDDVAYLGGLVEEVMAAWPIDPSRVVALGHSNGHFMSYRLACDRADLFTAIAGLAGAASSVDGAGCDPARPVSSLHVHGTADDTVLYAGGAFGGFAYPGADASVAQWAGHDGCAATRSAGDPRDLEQRLDGAETTVEVADGCPAGVGVELWTIVDGTHIPNLRPDAGAQLVAWLLAHPRP